MVIFSVNYEEIIKRKTLNDDKQKYDFIKKKQKTFPLKSNVAEWNNNEIVVLKQPYNILNTFTVVAF